MIGTTNDWNNQWLKAPIIKTDNRWMHQGLKLSVIETNKAFKEPIIKRTNA